MRYKKDQNIFFLEIDSKRTGPSLTSLYDPNVDKVNCISVHGHHCMAHFKVPDQYSDEPKHDGYIFLDENLQQWHSQYPVAKVEAVDDKNDWIATREEKLENGDVKRYRRYDARWYLARIYDNYINSQEKDKEYAEKLFEHFNQIVLLMKYHCNKLVRVTPIPWVSKTSGVEEKKVIISVDLVDVTEEAAQQA